MAVMAALGIIDYKAYFTVAYFTSVLIHESTKDEFWPKICRNTAFISRRIIRRIIGPDSSIPFVSSINSDVLACYRPRE